MEKMTVTEGAAIIDAVGDSWIGSKSKLSIYTVTRRAANKLSKNRIFNLAAYLKYDFSYLEGVNDFDWIQTAKEAQKILGGK
jgi:hypothetical protein